jgi:hypothetical protein
MRDLQIQSIDHSEGTLYSVIDPTLGRVARCMAILYTGAVGSLEGEKET